MMEGIHNPYPVEEKATMSEGYPLLIVAREDHFEMTLCDGRTSKPIATHKSVRDMISYCSFRQISDELFEASYTKETHLYSVNVSRVSDNSNGDIVSGSIKSLGKVDEGLLNRDSVRYASNQFLTLSDTTVRCVELSAEATFKGVAEWKIVKPRYCDSTIIVHLTSEYVLMVHTLGRSEKECEIRRNRTGEIMTTFKCSEFDTVPNSSSVLYKIKVRGGKKVWKVASVHTGATSSLGAIDDMVKYLKGKRKGGNVLRLAQWINHSKVLFLVPYIALVTGVTQVTNVVGMNINTMAFLDELMLNNPDAQMHRIKSDSKGTPSTFYIAGDDYCYLQYPNNQSLFRLKFDSMELCELKECPKSDAHSIVLVFRDRWEFANACLPILLEHTPLPEALAHLVIEYLIEREL
jgi:hypothetical protein